MSLITLRTLMPPPQILIEPGHSGGWPAIEEQLRTKLPQDYKEYINTYGSGHIGRFLWPFNPFSSSPVRNLFKQVSLHLDAFRKFRKEFGAEGCPYPLFPEPGGLLPWGVTDNGDVLFWLTQEDPQQWQVVVGEGRGPDFERYPESMTGFLVKLISHEIVSRIIPYRLIDSTVLFVPY